MRLLLPFVLVLSMNGTEIERAQQVARSRDSEREQFHRRYVTELRDASVVQLEVITEFRRLVLVTEEHIKRGDWLFSRSARSAEEAIAPLKGTVMIRGIVRFNPLNTFITPPSYAIAMGGQGAKESTVAIDTQVLPQYSSPYKGRNGKMVSALMGAVLEGSISASELGQASRVLAITLEGKELARTTVDFGRLD